MPYLVAAYQNMPRFLQNSPKFHWQFIVVCFNADFYIHYVERYALILSLAMPNRLPRPPVSAPPEDGENEQQQRESLAQLHRFAEGVFNENINGVRYSSWYVRVSFWALLTMYIALFLVGLVTAAFAIIRGFQTNTGGEAAGALAIGGLSAASFFSLFLSRPLESLERNSIYLAWLTATQNTYWTRLMYFSDLETIDAELEDATEDLVKHLTTLADKHAAATGKYSALASQESAATSGGNQAGNKGTMANGGTRRTNATEIRRAAQRGAAAKRNRGR